MKKPTKHSKEYYNYNKCRNYLEKKYKYKERDFANKYPNKKKPYEEDESKPYLDFWHWVVDNYDIHNGCFITFDKNFQPEEDWQKEIYNHYIEEFGNENGEVELYVSW